MNRIAEITVNYSTYIKKDDRHKITSSREAETHFRAVWSDSMEHIEEMYLMLLNRSNEVLGYTKISMGGINATLCDPKVIFQVALKGNASGILLAHNHPSGALKPSEQDIRLTKKIKEGAGLLDMGFLDHIILSKEGCFSFADDGLI